MRKKLTDNWPLKLLSLVLATLLWIMVLGIEDPVYTKEFTDVEVTEINGDQITEEGKAYSYSDGNTVSFKVKGKTSIISRLTKDDFLAVADLSKMSITGAVTVDISCPRYPSLEISPVGTSTVLNIEIEDLIEKSLNVKVITDGDGPDNKYVGTGVATPNMITVSGPASVVNQVKEAVVNIKVTNENMSDITTTTSLVLQDENGSTVDDSTLTVSQTKIDVVVPIYDTKTVPIEFQVTGKVADGYELVETAFEPKEVTIAGRKDDLENVDSIVMRDYDVSDADSTIEDSLVIEQNLLQDLPDGVTLYNSEETLAVVVTIEQLEDKALNLPVSKISLLGTDSDYIYEKGSDDSGERKVVLNLYGTKSAVTSLTADDVKAVVNVSGYDTGNYSLPVSVTLPNGVTLLEKTYLPITITQNNE